MGRDSGEQIRNVPENGQDDITAYWLAGDLISFCRLFEGRHRQKLRGYLIREFRLSEEDAEDSIGDALRELFDRHALRPSTVGNPIGYVTTCAKYAALRHREHWGAHSIGAADVERTYPAGDADEPGTDHRTEDGAGEGHISERLPLGVDDPAAIIESAVDARVTELVEASIEDAAVEASWAREIVGVAVTRLTVTEAKVIGLFLTRSGLYDASTNDFDIKSGTAQEELGMTAEAFRQAKSRAFRKLKAIIPKVIEELGINLPTRFDAELFPDKWPGPEGDQ